MKKLVLCLILLINSVCFAETLEFVVSASAGGPNDTVTRKIVEQLEKDTDLKITVINKPGAAHVIGYNYVKSSTKPVLILSTPEIANNSVYQEVVPIYTVGYFYNTVFVSGTSGIKTLKDLQAYKEVKFGHGGIGTFSHAGMLQLCNNLNCLDVPFKSGAEGMSALLSNTIDAYALVSYGAKAYSNNPRYTSVYDIKPSIDKSWWLKIFAKNISEDTAIKISAVLNKQPTSFYTDLGIYK